MSWPNTLTVPAVLLTSEVTMPISVVLPAPFGPEQGEEIALLHVEVDALQGLDAILVGLGETLYGECMHAPILEEMEARPVPVAVAHATIPAWIRNGRSA